MSCSFIKVTGKAKKKKMHEVLQYNSVDLAVQLQFHSLCLKVSSWEYGIQCYNQDFILSFVLSLYIVSNLDDDAYKNLRISQCQHSG